MDVKTINISQIYSLDGNATLKCFLAGQSDEMAKYNQNLPALIIAPGGAYSFVSDREADPIALDFFTKHYNTFVLTYSVAPEGRYPLALTQYACAVDWVRSNANDLHIDPNKIYVLGFSAGGHLTANLCNFYHNLPIPEINGKKLDAKVNGAVLCYPVITPSSHEGSFKNLLNIDNVHCEKAEALSLEKSVTALNPPTFIWTTATDTCVNPLATVLYTKALIDAGIKYECHIFSQGEHGGSTFDSRTCKNEPSTNKIWLDLADNFLKSL